MGRNKRITTQELIRYTDEYLSENPGVKLTIPLLGNFIRCREGENDIRDYLIRRDIEFREYLNQLGLSAAAQDEAVEGAKEAFAFYKVILREIFGLPEGAEAPIQA